MSALRDAVQELADKCEGDDRPECPIPRDLEGTTPIPGQRA
jgi:MerR family copper efflux transcriptional regulator